MSRQVMPEVEKIRCNDCGAPLHQVILDRWSAHWHWQCENGHAFHGALKKRGMKHEYESLYA